MNVLAISNIESYMSWKVQKIRRLDVRKGNLSYREARLNDSISVDSDATHIIAHKCQSRAVDSLVGLAAPAVLCTQVGISIRKDGRAKFCL